MIIGSESPLTEGLSTVTFITSSMSGNSNIVFKRIFSKIDLNPLAPVFLEIAFLAISEIASFLVLVKFLLMISHQDHLMLR